MQPNTDQRAKKPSKDVWSRNDNMSSRLDIQEKISDLLNLYQKKDYLNKGTTKYTSILNTAVNYILMTLTGFQLS